MLLFPGLASRNCDKVGYGKATLPSEQHADAGSDPYDDNPRSSWETPEEPCLQALRLARAATCCLHSIFVAM